MGARTRELEARLSDAETELAQVRDALWISEAAEKRARAALVAAEQAEQADAQQRDVTCVPPDRGDGSSAPIW